MNVGALGQNNVAARQSSSIYSPRYNAVVVRDNTPSQPWITSDSARHGAGRRCTSRSTRR